MPSCLRVDDVETIVYDSFVFEFMLLFDSVCRHEMSMNVMLTV